MKLKAKYYLFLLAVGFEKIELLAPCQVKVHFNSIAPQIFDRILIGTGGGQFSKAFLLSQSVGIPL